MPRRQSLHSVSGQRPNPTLVEAGPWPLVLADPRRIGLLPLGLRVVRETGNLTRIQDRVKGSKAFLFQCFWTLRFCLQITRFPWVISLSKPRPASVGLLQRLAWFARVKKQSHGLKVGRGSFTRCPPHVKVILATLRYYASALGKVFSKRSISLRWRAAQPTTPATPAVASSRRRYPRSVRRQ
jgi:hypothetical protein